MLYVYINIVVYGVQDLFGTFCFPIFSISVTWNLKAMILGEGHGLSFNLHGIFVTFGFGEVS